MIIWQKLEAPAHQVAERSFAFKIHVGVHATELVHDGITGKISLCHSGPEVVEDAWGKQTTEKNNTKWLMSKIEKSELN